MQAWIFDVDGTLSNPTHRRHYTQNTPKRWDLWNKSMFDDTPHHDIIQFVHVAKDKGLKVLVSTGRSEDYRDITMSWLNKHDVFPDKMYMRRELDYRADDIVKKEMLDQMLVDGYMPLLAFDDRDKVVKMWRENNIRCLQVNYGDF